MTYVCVYRELFPLPLAFHHNYACFRVILFNALRVLIIVRNLLN